MEKNIPIPVRIHTEFIKLEAALKLCNAVYSGGEAKRVIAEGLVFVNKEICTMRGKKLYPGDQVDFENSIYVICNYEN